MASAWHARMAACYSMSSQAVAVRCICAARCVGQVVGQVVGQAEAAEQAEGGDGQVSFLTFRLQDLVAGGAAIPEDPENVLEDSFHPILPAVQSVIAAGIRLTYLGSGGPHMMVPFPAAFRKSRMRLNRFLCTASGVTSTHAAVRW